MTAFDAPAAHVSRDRFKRPLVIPPDGGKPKAYTRCTTFVDCLEDKYRLQRWQLRQTALGLSERPDLLLSVSAHRDNNQVLDDIADRAMEAAKTSAASTTGTAVHALCERVDRGQPLGIVPAMAAADVAAYRARTQGMRHVSIEQFTVHDGLKIGGTPDRVVWWGDHHYIADIKTGKDISFGALKIAMQLAVYANSQIYLPTGERFPHPAPMNLDRAIVIHLPVGKATCELHWVDIAAGWEAVQCASDVRGWRSRRGWYEPITPDTNPPAIAMATVDDMIAAASTVDELRQVWTAAIAAETWTETHLVHALERKEQLERAS